MKSAASFAVLAGVSGAMALPAEFACNPAHSYPNGAACVSSNGALTLVTPTPAPTSFACNPAHSYPNGASCVSTNGALSLVTPAPAPTSFACNPAHSYPNGASCVSTNGALSLVTPAPAPTSFACNPAHSYPAGAVCTAVSGTLALVTPSPTAAAAQKTAAPAVSGLGEWTIDNLVRYCNKEGTACDYEFVIKTSDGFESTCGMSQSGPKGSWANVPCNDGSVYSISWGYAENGNPPFAVMTVDQIQDKTRAFFGVPDVNGQLGEVFGSGRWMKLGPEPVNPLN